MTGKVKWNFKILRIILMLSITKYDRTYLQTLDSTRLQEDTVRYRARLIFLEADTLDSYLTNVTRKIFYTIAQYFN